MLASTTPAQEGLIIVGIFVGIIVVGVIAVMRDASRRKGIAAELKAAGFDVREGEREFDPVEDAVIADNPLLLYKRNKVRWSATVVHKKNVVRVYEYYFTTGYGRSRQNHYFLFAATDLPTQLSEFTMERKRWLMSHLPDLKAAPAPAEDPVVAGSFACYAADPSGAATLLSPAMCDELSTWDKKHLLRFSNGVLMVGRRGLGRMREINQTLETLDRVHAAAIGAVRSASSSARMAA